MAATVLLAAIAGIALRARLFARPSPTPREVEHLSSAAMIMAVATTPLTPLILRYSLKRDE